MTRKICDGLVFAFLLRREMIWQNLHPWQRHHRNRSGRPKGRDLWSDPLYREKDCDGTRCRVKMDVYLVVKYRPREDNAKPGDSGSFVGLRIR